MASKTIIIMNRKYLPQMSTERRADPLAVCREGADLRMRILSPEQGRGRSTKKSRDVWSTHTADHMCGSVSFSTYLWCSLVLSIKFSVRVAVWYSVEWSVEQCWDWWVLWWPGLMRLYLALLSNGCYIWPVERSTVLCGGVVGWRRGGSHAKSIIYLLTVTHI